MVNTTLQNQNNTRRFDMVLCELFNSHVHGGDDNIIEPVDGHYLIVDKFDGISGTLIEDDDEFYEDSTDDDYSDSDDDDYSNNSTSITSFSQDYNTYYHFTNNIVLLKPHKLIRNYQNIIARPDYIKPEIAECIVLPSHHSVAIIKTIWIKLIQRKWKKVYAERTNIIRQRMHYSSLKTRELTGNWPRYCDYLPTIYGIMSELKYHNQR